MSHQPRLFTPGPLTTSDGVRAPMQFDYGSRDRRFVDGVREIQMSLISLCQSPRMECVLMQGSGTFGMESALDTFLSDEDRILILINGAYGRRAREIAERLGKQVVTVEWSENESIDPDAVSGVLSNDPSITHVWVVHCETTTGLMNDLESIGRVVAGAGKRFLVDAMSSFGGIPIDFDAAHIDVLISSANKCIEGVPGFSFMLVDRSVLEKSEGNARSTSLDACAQWKRMAIDGQFRFTPPTQVLMAFLQALRELHAEGGIEARHARYTRTARRIAEGMRSLGFQMYLPAELQGPIISTWLYPDASDWDFPAFYELLAERGLVIYPGKLTEADCFRIGNIGRLSVDDVEELLEAIREIMAQMLGDAPQ